MPGKVVPVDPASKEKLSFLTSAGTGWMLRKINEVLDGVRKAQDSRRQSVATELAETRDAMQSGFEVLRHLHEELRANTQLGELLGEVQAELTEVRRELKSLTETLNQIGRGAQAGEESETVAQRGMMAALREVREQLQQTVEAQQSLLQATVNQIREDLKVAATGIRRESVEIWEQRQVQPEVEQQEVEQIISRLREELAAPKRK